jgi:hypothetical protein
MAGLLTFAEPFVNTHPFFTGRPSNNLVPDIFPIAIDGRPYLVDQKSSQFMRGFEARVRDSVDQSTSPGEAAINPQGLWRRGETSWHLGAGQLYADTAEAQDYRFYSSKGINPWTKGQLKLLNKVKESLSSGNTNLHLHVADGKLYVADGATVKYSSNPFASSPTWTSVTGLPNAVPRDMSSDGSNIYLTYAGLSSSYGLWKIDDSQVASNVAYGHELYYVDYVKGYVMVAGNSASGNSNDLYYSPSGNIGADDYSHPLSTWNWTSFASGQNAIYVAGHSGDKGAIYKITIASTGVLDTPVVALEFPTGEIPYTVYGYLGGIFIGTSKGVRYATSDNDSNLVSGSLIPTSGSVTTFTADDKYVWFNWSNYDGVSTGLGRIDLSSFTSANTPAYSTDLMHTSTASVLHVVTYDNKRVFSISGDGVYVEDAANLVETGEIVTGTYRWGIPDRKFVAKFDVRTTPLEGVVTPYISIDSAAYVSLSPHSQQSATEKVSNGPQSKFIEAKFKLELARATATTGPTVTRWMARAYASPARSQVFRVPILMHHKIVDNRGSEHYFDVEVELEALRALVTNPVVVNYQENTETFSVVVEDLEFQVIDGYYQNWDLEGTCIVTMRSVQD